jgi:hypothetical protein
MTDRPSFERFDYLLRANKHVERKLVFDTLQRAAASQISLLDHRYLGFGSMWFGDFRFAHKQLGINLLTSIEKAEFRDRADFNKPYGCIEVLGGDALDVLSKFDAARWSLPYVAWFDFDGRLDESIVELLEIFMLKAAKNSVVIVTVNANRGSYRTKSPDPKSREDTSVGMLEKLLGATMIDVKYSPGILAGGTYSDINVDVFPKCLSESMLTFLQHKIVQNGRSEGSESVHFVPLFSIGHRDGAQMATVGGALASLADRTRWSDIQIKSALSDYRSLELVPITIKEKLALDASEPHRSADYLARARASGVLLDDVQVEMYCQYFKHFPVFVETVM